MTEGRSAQSSRSTPDQAVVAEEIRRLEDAEAAFMTASRMGAIATTLFTLVRAGDRIVAARQVYGDTRDLLVRDLPAWEFDVGHVDALDVAAWRAAVAGGPTRLVYVETLTNPQLDLADLPALAEIAHSVGAVLVVDNTFATPYSVHPLELGADVVVHSATEFLNGHSDVIAGVVAGRFDQVREVQWRVITLGDLSGSACGVPRVARSAGLRAPAVPVERDRTLSWRPPWRPETTWCGSDTRPCPTTNEQM